MFYMWKALLLVHKAFIGGSPPYLADMITTRNTTRSTRSSHRVNLIVSHHGVSKYTEKAFAVAGPRLWNELLTDELRGCNSLDTFKNTRPENSGIPQTLLMVIIMYFIRLYFVSYYLYFNVYGFTFYVSYNYYVVTPLIRIHFADTGVHAKYIINIIGCNYISIFYL